MKKISFQTTYKKILADIYTPVGIYLRVRDHYRDTILLESTDFHSADNNYSIIGINAIGGIEIKDINTGEVKYPSRPVEKLRDFKNSDVPQLLMSFMDRFQADTSLSAPVNIAQSLFGYTSYDSVAFFEKNVLKQKAAGKYDIPTIRYRLYQFLIIIDHFKDELFICENHFEGLESDISKIEGLIRSKDVPSFPFLPQHSEVSVTSDNDYIDNVKKGIAACKRGDVFQVVLSRRFEQKFTGDDFNVYRALRSINPGPYLFYFDYGDYKLFGSSPESQVIINKGEAVMHPIAGTFKRTGDDETDKSLAKALENDAKENAEHIMLVDLARNDLSRLCTDVEVSRLKQTVFYSHVIHMVSEVKGVLKELNPFKVLGTTFPAGTLSGAPKHKAMQLIDDVENVSRGFYGGAIGFYGLNGDCNHAIMIRTFLSKNNTLVYQAGAGIVSVSDPLKESEEVNNKLAALKKAIALAKDIN